MVGTFFVAIPSLSALQGHGVLLSGAAFAALASSEVLASSKVLASSSSGSSSSWYTLYATFILYILHSVFLFLLHCVFSFFSLGFRRDVRHFFAATLGLKYRGTDIAPHPPSGGGGHLYPWTCRPIPFGGVGGGDWEGWNTHTHIYTHTYTGLCTRGSPGVPESLTTGFPKPAF